MRKNKNKKEDDNFKIQLPNLMLIPFLAILCSLIKLCGGAASYSWLSVLIIMPAILYVGWSLSFIFLLLMCALVAKIIKPKEND